MQQDSQPSTTLYFEPLMQASDQLPLPIALVDQDLNQFWENQYLKKSYPFLCSRDNVHTLLQGYDIDASKISLLGQNASFSCPSKLPMVQTVLTFSPVYDSNEVFLGAVVHFSVSSPQMFPDDANRAQEILQNFSTSIRDPLNSVFSSISSMERRLEVEDITSCEYLLQQINQHCYHMLKSCSSLSEYISYSNGLAVLQLKYVSLNLYLNDLLAHLQMLARKADVKLSYTLPKEEIELYLDPDKLIIVLASLISNSIAFAEERTEGKKIHIKVGLSKNHVQFTVSDNGIGISPDILPYVFEPYFTKGRNDLQFSHLGLGLSICKMIAAHHGGTISILSNDDEGTSVTFTISRNLKNDQPGEIVFCDNPIDDIVNSFSPMYVYLADVYEHSVI